MASRSIDIKLGTTYDGSGAKAAKRDMHDLSKAVGIVGQEAGGTASKLSTLAKGLMTGGPWTMVIAAISAAGVALKKWWDEAKEVTEKSNAQLSKAMDGLITSVNSYKDTIAETAAAERKLVDENLKRKNAEIAATERLKKAEIELSRQRRIAAGEDASIVNADANAALGGLDANTKRQAAQAKIAAARRALFVAEGENFAAGEEAARLEEAYNELPNWYDFNSEELQKKNRAYRRSVRDKMNSAKRLVNTSAKQIEDARAVLAAAEQEAETVETEIAAAEAKAANDAVANAKKTAAEREKAELAAAQAAAKEREQLEKELHAQRMADLKAEIDAQKSAANSLKATAAAAQSEFDKAFALFRSPDSAAAQRAEDEAYRTDLNRLHKTASRYGGKWRIDELAALMAAGDTQGVSDTLATWRKSKSFSPEVEAMVRASAAEKTKTTTEEELRKIATNTANLDQKLDSLLQVKGGANG